MIRIKIIQGYSQGFDCACCGMTFAADKGGLSIRVFPDKGGDILLGICQPCLDSKEICIEQIFKETDKVMSPKFLPA